MGNLLTLLTVRADLPPFTSSNNDPSSPSVDIAAKLPSLLEFAGVFRVRFIVLDDAIELCSMQNNINTILYLKAPFYT